MTNKQLMENLLDKIVLRIECLNDLACSMSLPGNKVYGITGLYKIEEFEVQELRFSYKPFPVKIKSRYYKKDLELATEYLEYVQNIDEDSIWIVIRNLDESNLSRRFSITKLLKEILRNERYSFNKDDLESLSKELTEKYAPIPGYGHCRYCSRVVPNEELIERTIYSIATYGPGGRNFKYCSSKCATYDQYAHEG